VGCHPLRKVPSLRGRGRHLFVTAGYFSLLQSGHGHWSQPQPVHASRIMQRFYRGPAPVEVGDGRPHRQHEPTDLEDHGRAKADAAAVRAPPSSPTLFLDSRARAFTRACPCFASCMNLVFETLR
jgi:hypothetical protein